MKIDQEKPEFRPVTITLESMDEVNMVWKMLTESIHGTLNANQRSFRHAILNKLEAIPSYDS